MNACSDTLSLVITDKLPFTSPGSPLLKARMGDCRLRGGGPPEDVQLSDAVTALKQGMGRLVCDTNDHGMLVTRDNRLAIRPYGATFLAGLSLTPWTHDIAHAVRFLATPATEQSATECGKMRVRFIDLITNTHTNFGYRYRHRGVLCYPME